MQSKKSQSWFGTSDETHIFITTAFALSIVDQLTGPSYRPNHAQS
jgi:hypothetical protein